MGDDAITAATGIRMLTILLHIAIAALLGTGTPRLCIQNTPAMCRRGIADPTMRPIIDSRGLNHPRLLPKRDELPRPALHRFIVCVLRSGEVTDQSDQLLDALIGIIPKFDLEG